MMRKISPKGNFSQRNARNDELRALPPNACSLGGLSSEESEDEVRAAWAELAAHGLAAAYGPDEPEYSLDLLREKNPSYSGE